MLHCGGGGSCGGSGSGSVSGRSGRSIALASQSQAKQGLERAASDGAICLLFDHSK